LRDGAHSVLAAAARFYTPLIVLFAVLLLIVRAPGTGVGFVAGLALLLALIVHALVFGVRAALAALPAPLTRAIAAAALAATVLTTLPLPIAFATELREAGLFALTAAGGALAIAALFGRAPTMREPGP